VDVRGHPALTAVDVGRLDLARLAAVLDDEAREDVEQGAERGNELLEGRTVWNINSTAKGGGVAEMLITLLAYAQGVGVDTRWLVIGGDDPFFRVTKRIHNRLHGAEGDGHPLGEDEHQDYTGPLERAGEALRETVSPNDVVILHDPQTAGLIPVCKDLGVPVIWRCHVGLDTPNDLARDAWRFLEPYVSLADAYVFSREAFAWEDLERDKLVVIAPSIDALAPKNQDLEDATTHAILHAAGLRDGQRPEAPPRFKRFDGSDAEVQRKATVLEEATLGEHDRFVLQVSRWDRLKDPLGVIKGFAEHVAPHCDVHLVYAGPDVTAVTDDPEGQEVLDEAKAFWHDLPDDVRKRIHLALLPMDDGDENAAMVNALQRAASVVVQKSLAEGFGLTVAEAMWKARPVVATRIGGIQDQIEHGDTGILLDDPKDLAAYGEAVRKLVDDPDGAEAMGERARERIREGFLGTRSLLDYLSLLERVL
jgi:trehalose synthase